jgi:transcriptional regulator with XRE-family HTH domain
MHGARRRRVALPFCCPTLRAQKPLPAAYPKELNTLGDHVRKRRLDLGLTQKQVAREIGAHVTSVRNWEGNATTPALRFVPGIVRFLGYVPFPPSQGLSERLKGYRRVQGLSQRDMAQRLGVEESTVARWERGRSRPAERLRKHMRDLVGEPL